MVVLLTVYVVETLVRKRAFVEAKNKKAAETLGKAIAEGSVLPPERSREVEGTEVLAGVYDIKFLDEEQP